MNTTNHHGAGMTNDSEYAAFLERVNARFQAVTGGGAKPVFTTDAEGLWDAYLGAFADPAERQHHNCSACRQFINRFGSLAVVNDDGTLTPAVWNEDDAPEHYRAAVAALARSVRRAKVSGVFLASERVWGHPRTGDWRHLSVTPPAAMIHRDRAMTPGQKMAEKREDFGAVQRALAEFSLEHLEQAVTLLQTDSLYRSEKLLGQATWLRDLSRVRDKGNLGRNLVWRAIAQAPAGFCHPRSGMIGTLLEDLAAGMAYDDVARRFADKMHPLRYQRPQAAPTAGAVKAAEELVAKLGIAESLPRRFALESEIQALWRPAPGKAAPAGGVFAGIATKDAKAPAAPMAGAPAQVMTWDKFSRMVLPTAERIEVHIGSGPASYTTLTTAVNADAPPILQWDSEGERNPFAWYFWHGGSSAASYGLPSGSFVEVLAVSLKPSMWRGSFEHQGKGVLFVLKGAKDSRTPSACLFPEILRSELHGARSVVEAYSNANRMQPADGQHAAGLMLHAGDGRAAWGARLRVTSGGRVTEVMLDRWD